ncbi:MAG: hypothetical protein H6662_02845 [Ardenticatenaceae bacterium]|nr:hypothetical protein [Ardenticatenaceae bacterium]
MVAALVTHMVQQLAVQRASCNPTVRATTAQPRHTAAWHGESVAAQLCMPRIHRLRAQRGLVVPLAAYPSSSTDRASFSSVLHNHLPGFLPLIENCS